MDRESCGMNGRGGHNSVSESVSLPSLRIITLVDLESFTEDEDLDPDSFGDNADLDGQNEVMEQEDQDRLLNFWQDVGRGHAIDIPQGKMYFDIAQLFRVHSGLTMALVCVNLLSLHSLYEQLG